MCAFSELIADLFQLISPILLIQMLRSKRFYDLLVEVVDAGRRAGYRIFIGGDINAEVGGGDYTSNHPAAGPYDLGEQNARGQWLLGWASSRSSKIGNTMFRKQDEQLVTHIGTQGQWSQLNCFLVDNWFVPGGEILSLEVLLTWDLTIRL